MIVRACACCGVFARILAAACIDSWAAAVCVRQERLQGMLADRSTTLDEAQDPVPEDNEEVPVRQYCFPLCFCACVSAASVCPQCCGSLY